jgi:hypothetical protein
MPSFPSQEEAAPYYFVYIDQVSRDADILALLESQLAEVDAFAATVSGERSLHRYAPDKWSIREVLNHITDTERAFVFRAAWFARRFAAPLPGFDQDVAAAAARADSIPWSRHLAEWRAVRQSTIEFFRNLPADAWTASGIASENCFTVNALAYIVAGHVRHHLAILRQRYV